MMRGMFFFFFSSRRRHTRSLCDWSSDVCSSDLPLDSPPPQLIDTSVAPRLLADTTALKRFVLLLLAASTSTILAAGASACAHSISSDSSSTHPALTLGVPCGSTCSKHGPLWVSDVHLASVG